MSMHATQTSTSEALLPEFDEEMALTRKSLERVPEHRFDWKPHDRSATLGWLATFLAVLPSWAVGTMRQDSLDLAPGGKEQPPAPPRKGLREVLELFDHNVAEARAAIATANDAAFREPWSLLRGGKPLMTRTRAQVLRGMVLNHMIHHRAQLGVYLRLLDVPVPAVYGPTADENPWG